MSPEQGFPGWGFSFQRKCSKPRRGSLGQFFLSACDQSQMFWGSGLDLVVSLAVVLVAVVLVAVVLVAVVFVAVVLVLVAVVLVPLVVDAVG